MRVVFARVGFVAAAVAAVVAGFSACGPCAEDKAGKSEVAVAEVKGDALEKAIKGQKDKVVVVDCWATWCVPCVKKFPHLVELHKKYADKGLVCVSVSLDLLGDKEAYKKEKVLTFLKGKGAAFPNFIAADPDDDKQLEVVLGEDFRLLPYMVIFDKAGRRVWDSSNGPELKDDQLDKKIEELLAK
jgi:thiol-disulfide isomerase/thioredoxin